MLCRMAGCISMLVLLGTAWAGSNSTYTLETLELRGERIEEAASIISDVTSTTIIVRPRLRGARVDLKSGSTTVTQLLDQVVKQIDHALWYAVPDEPGTFELWDESSYRYQVMPKLVQQRTLKLNAITAEEAYKAIQGMLTPNVGSAVFDPRTNQLFVKDLPQVLASMEDLLKQIDVKFPVRVFAIRHADVMQMAEHLGNLKSPAAPVPMVDRRTRQIVVHDRIEIIREMELLVATFDVETTNTKEVDSRAQPPSPPMPPRRVAR